MPARVVVSSPAALEVGSENRLYVWQKYALISVIIVIRNLFSALELKEVQGSKYD